MKLKYIHCVSRLRSGCISNKIREYPNNVNNRQPDNPACEFSLD